MKTEVEVVNKIARRFAARCWWAEMEDLVQEGWIALLTAKKTWDPSRGVSLTNYASRAVALHLGDYLWHMGAPVSGARGHGRRLEGMHRVPETALERHPTEDTRDPAVEHWWEETTSRMEEVLRKADSSGVAIRVVWWQEPASQVAEEMGVRTEEVHAKAKLARRYLRQDARLCELVSVVDAQTC